MAIKRWNASTSQWELVGTPGTATPSAIGAATLASTGNTFLGVQTITSASEWPLISRFTNPTSTHRNHILMQRSNNNTAVTAGFNLGGISMAGHDGTSYALGWNGGAEITAYASQTWTPSARGTDLVIATSYSNTTGPSERFRIAANDTFGFNVSAPAYGIHHRVFGNAEIATQYGTGAVTYIGAYAAEGSLRVTGANPLTFYTNNTEAMRIDAVQNVQIGSGSEFNGLRYIDLYNRNSGVNAGAIIRLITNNAANTAVTTVDIVKYRNGTFLISNNDTAGIIAFNNAGSERMRIGSTGNVTIGATNTGSHKLYIEDAQLIDTTRMWNTNASFGQHVMQTMATRANTSAYYFYSAYSSGGGDAEFWVRGDGQVASDSSYTSNGADYAEYFEWADGNPNNEDRVGYSVSLINDKIKIAEEGEVVFGIVSGNPSVVGDGAPMKWTGKYLKNDFGSYIRNEDGERVLNPEYDEDSEYISREDRPEWSAIGLMGKLRLRKGQAVGTNWIKMKDISEQVEEWLVR